MAIGGVLASGRVPSTWLLALAVIFGLSHGARDVDRGRRLFRAAGAAWWLPFLAVYLGLVAVTLAAWAIVPALALAAFLLLSAIHFGMQDAGDERDARWPAAVAAHGGAVIVLPACFHAGEVRHLFALLVGEGAATLKALIAGPAAAMWLGAVALIVLDASRGRRAWPALVDLLLVGILFAAASPLVAFALYFAVLHTPRALASQRGASGKPALSRQAVAVTALACLIGIGIFLVGPRLGVDARIVRTSFVLLSALTVPHMALDHVAPALVRRRSLSSGSRAGAA